MVNKTTLVSFRKWRDGDIIALFPEIPSDINGFFCDAYEHVGQHGGADYHCVVQATRPASHKKAASLAKELTRYNLQPIRRASQTIHERQKSHGTSA